LLPRPAIPTSSKNLKKGKQIDGVTYEVHLDGYKLDTITGKVRRIRGG
jgi:hypothetical protein